VVPPDWSFVCMRKTFWLSVFLLLSISSFAQANDPRWEAFGGYSYLRTNPGGGSDGANSSGWNASLDYNLGKHWGFKADLDGHYCCSQKEHNFLFGPQVQFHALHGKVFVHGLAGLSNAKASAFDFSDTVFAWAAGGGFDLPLSSKSHWALRLAQADYLGTHYSNTFQHNFRYSGGIVYSFGKR
jgi:outer membrane protein with beta-barrel domain